MSKQLMMSSRESLTIETCPHCGKSHVYEIRVRRSLVYHHALSPVAEKKRVIRLFTCPETKEDFQAEIVLGQEPQRVIEEVSVTGLLEPKHRSPETTTASFPVVSSITAISPHNRAIYEAGKALLIDSINVSRDFCKSMITICFSAIPIYLGILGFKIPGKLSLTAREGALLATPAGIFLLAGLSFVIGYLPITTRFSLDLPTEIEEARVVGLARRRRMIKLGLGAFVAGVLMATIFVIIMP